MHNGCECIKQAYCMQCAAPAQLWDVPVTGLGLTKMMGESGEDEVRPKAAD